MIDPRHLIYPLGKVIRVTQIAISTQYRLKPRYLIYFGYLDEEEKYHIFCTTTAQIDFYVSGNRASIPTYHFIHHSCFKKHCCLDVNGFYFLRSEEIKNLGNIQECCRLSKEEFYECLRVSTYDIAKTNLPKKFYDYLRFLLINNLGGYNW